MKRDVREVREGEVGLIVSNRMGNGLGLVVHDEREQEVAVVIGLVAALICEDG